MGVSRLYEAIGAGEWVVTNRMLHGDRTEDGRERSVCTKEAERRMGGDESFVWCYRRKVYRLSENTL